MTSTVAVAQGAVAVEALRAAVATEVAAGGRVWRSAGGHAVSWDDRCPWIGVHDDGDVLVVLDGRLHHGLSPSVPDLGSAAGLLARYRTLGTRLAEGLLGDFVLVVLDRGSKTLLVARDPVGVRPWYQAAAHGGQLGATDVATLVGLDGVDAQVDETAALRYLSGLARGSGETFHRGIRTLAPGHTWHSGPAGSRVCAHHCWDVRPDLEIGWEEAAERCRVRLDEAVRCRLPADEPAASELSGGLDSSAVVGTAMRSERTDLVVGRLLFTGRRADERGYSEQVARFWGLPLISAAPWIPTEQEADSLTRELQRPLPGPNFTMFQGLHSALGQAGRPVSLTGLGGDDAFVAMPVGTRVASAVQLRQGQVLGALVREGLREPRRGWRQVLRPTVKHFAPWRGSQVPPWIGPAAAGRVELPALLRHAVPRWTGISALDKRLSGLSSGYVASILEDRALLADRAGRRDTHPFLDPRLVHDTYGLNPWWPVRDGHFRALQVHAYADRLPPAVAARRTKAEFSEVVWPQLVDAQLLERVRTGPLRDAGWLLPAGFDMLLGKAREGRASAALPLSRCLALDRWLRSR